MVCISGVLVGTCVWKRGLHLGAQTEVPGPLSSIPTLALLLHLLASHSLKATRRLPLLHLTLFQASLSAVRHKLHGICWLAGITCLSLDQSLWPEKCSFLTGQV